MELDYGFIIKSFIALFIIVDPVGIVPVFISLLGRFKETERQAMIRRSVIIAGITLLVLTLIGNVIFSILGVSMYSFRIAGGILLLIISVEMLFGRRTKTGISDNLEMEKDDVVIMPMAIPLLTGPGAITTGIMLFDTAGEMLNRIFLIIDIILVFLVSYWILSRLDYIYRILGPTGTRVVIRIMGLMLSAIAVQFVISGVAEAITTLHILG